MVHTNKNFIFASFQIIALSFKGFNNSQKLLIMSFVPYFNKNHLFEKKSY